MFNVVLAASIQPWGDVKDGGCMIDNVPTLKCLEVVFGNVLTFASSFIILVLFVMFIWGSISYLTSLGNPEKVKKAQNTFKFAIVGLVLFLSSFLILRVIDYLFLGGEGRLFQFSIEGELPTTP